MCGDVGNVSRQSTWFGTSFGGFERLVPSFSFDDSGLGSGMIEYCLPHCRVLCPPSGIWLGMRPSGRSKLGLESRPTGCIARRCGKVGTLNSEAHRPTSCYHPTEHGNDWVD